MDLELRTSPPAHATGSVEFVPLAEVADDETFRLREDGEVADLATSIGRLGQLAPVELRLLPGAAPGEPRWQVVAGFRRLAALRLLQRDRVLARLHEALSDEDAWALAAVNALLGEPLGNVDLEAVREKLRAAGVGWAEDLVDEAQARAPLPPELREKFHLFLRQARAAPAGAEGEGGETVEMSPEEVVQDILRRLAELNVDLAAAWEAWAELPPEGRRQIVEQARYLRDLFPFMERDAG